MGIIAALEDDAARRLLRRGRLSRARRAPVRARGSTWRSGPWCTMPRPAMRQYGVGGGITWDSQAAAEYDETVAKARVLTERRPPTAPAGNARPRAGRRLPASRGPSGPSAVIGRLPRDRDRRGRDRRGVGSGSRAVPHEGGAGAPAGRSSWTRRDRVGAADGHAGTGSPGDRPRPSGRSRRSVALPQDHAARAVRRRARAVPRRRRCRPGEHAGRRDRDHPREHRRAARRTMGHAPDRGRSPARCERAALLADGTLVEERVTVGDLEAAEDVAFLNSVRGWKHAVLVGGV